MAAIAALPEVTQVEFEVECPICLDFGSGSPWRILPCRHACHGACLIAWVKRAPRSTCPVCRGDVCCSETHLAAPPAMSNWVATAPAMHASEPVDGPAAHAIDTSTSDGVAEAADQHGSHQLHAAHGLYADEAAEGVAAGEVAEAPLDQDSPNVAWEVASERSAPAGAAVVDDECQREESQDQHVVSEVCAPALEHHKVELRGQEGSSH